MSNLTIRGPVPVLFTNDMPQAIAYYRDTLGFTLADAMPDDDPAWCFLRRDKTAIMLLSSDDHDEGQEDDHKCPVAPAVSSLYFYPDNVDTLWNRLKDKVEIVVPVQDMDYGMREFTIRDPNGIALNFGTPLNA